jgi:hypothetical protein
MIKAVNGKYEHRQQNETKKHRRSKGNKYRGDSIVRAVVAHSLHQLRANR